MVKEGHGSKIKLSTHHYDEGSLMVAALGRKNGKVLFVHCAQVCIHLSSSHFICVKPFSL